LGTNILLLHSSIFANYMRVSVTPCEVLLLSSAKHIHKTLGNKRDVLCTHTKTGNQTGQVDMPWCKHMKLLKAGYGSCLNKRVWMVLCDCTPHQTGRTDCWNCSSVT